MANFAIHGTAAATVTTVTLDRYFSRVQVVNRGTADIFFTTDGVTEPVVAADDTWVAAKNDSKTVGNQGPVFEPVWYGADTEMAQLKQPAKTIVKLISSGTPDFSVLGA